MSTPLPSGPRTYPFIKVIWGSSDVVKAGWQLGLFGFYSHIPGYPRSGLAISGRGIVRWGLVLGVVGYFSIAAVAARWLARDPANQIGFFDLLAWPWRRERIAELRGRAWLDHGKAAVNAKRWAEGVFYLRRGLEAWPGDFEARLALGRFHLMAGERARALALLAEGPRTGPPPRSWLEVFFSLATEGEDWSTVLLVCDRSLTWLRDPGQRGEREQLLTWKCTALLGLGRSAEALALAEAAGESAQELALSRARALVALGRHTEAAEFAARPRAMVRFSNQIALVELRAQAWREVGRFDDMDRALAELRALRPAQPGALAFAVEQRARAGLDAEAALNDYLFRFGGLPQNLQLVIRPLAEIPDVALVRRVVDAADERGYAVLPFRVPLAMAYLRHGDTVELARELVELTPLLVRADENMKRWFEWMNCLSGALILPLTVRADSLLTLLQTKPVGLEAHRLTVLALRRAGRHEAARDVLQISRRLFAECPWLRTQQIEVEVALTQAAAVPPIAKIATPGTVPITPNWRAFFQSTDDAIARGQWTEARELLAAARVAQPTWLAAREGELIWRELRVADGLHDTPAMRLALGVYLNGALERAAAVLVWARELHAAGRRKEAVLLVRAVQERMPDHPLAQSQLAEWAPRKPSP